MMELYAAAERGLFPRANCISVLPGLLFFQEKPESVSLSEIADSVLTSCGLSTSDDLIQPKDCLFAVPVLQYLEFTFHQRQNVGLKPERCAVNSAPLLASLLTQGKLSHI